VKIILAEKPSVANSFASSLKAHRYDGYFKNNEYIITFCVGHLLELYEPEDYNEKMKKWNISDLPIIPEKFRHKPSIKTNKQLNIIKRLFKNKISEVVLATDAGREGELIGRLVLSYCNYKGKIKRFWISNKLTDEIIKKEMNQLKRSEDYDHHFKEGLIRSVTDWLIGINYSRYFSCSFDGKFSFGRVQTVVLSLICERKLEIDNFIPKIYYKMEGIFNKNNIEFKAYYTDDNKENFKKETLENIIKEIKNDKTGRVISVEKIRKSVSPPQLYHLTALCRKCNNLYGFSSLKTANIAQKLYEEYKVLSYPRTPSRVMGEDDINFIKELLDKLKRNYKELNNININLINVRNKRVFNDKELEDHHALLPLDKLPDKASEDEKKVYELVLKSLVAVFSPNYEYNSTKICINVKNVMFIAKGIEEIIKGWKILYKEEKRNVEENKLPELSKNEIIKLKNVDIIKKITKPPSIFTEGELSKVLEYPEKYKKNNNYKFEKKVGISTETTRPHIIPNLKRKKYVEQKGRKIYPTDKGLFLYNQIIKLPQLIQFTDVAETARWEYELKSDPYEFMRNMIAFIRNNFAKLKTYKLSSFNNNVSLDESLGSCPGCGEKIREGNKNYYCSGYKNGCEFAIWKEISKTKITKKIVEKLLTNKKTDEIKFTSKAGKKFRTKLVIKDNKVKFAFAK